MRAKKASGRKLYFYATASGHLFFLVIMDDRKRLDMKKLSELINEKGISFCSPGKLKEKMGLPPGVVSIFGLLNNHERDIRVYLDKEMLSERIVTFHANDNTKTVFVSTEDMYKFLEELGYEYFVIDL